MKQINNQKGLSIIELMTVIAIIGILTSVAVIGWRERGEGLALKRSAHQLSQDIRKVQELAMRAEDFEGTISRGGFGIRLIGGVSYYILFADCNASRSYNATGGAANCKIATIANPFPEQLEIRELEEGVKVISVSPSPATITFIPPAPSVSINNFHPTYTSVIITLGINGLTRNITVNNAGLVAIE